MLFISFYLATYQKDGRPPTARKSLRRMSQAALPGPHVVDGTILGEAKTTGARVNGVSTRSRKA